MAVYKKVSIVIPLWNEGETVELLGARLCKLLPMAGYRTELLFVDDGSRDETRGLVRRLAGQLGECRLICLARNFGQQAAYRAGLDRACGDAVVFMDADCQDPPEKIPDLLKAWEGGAKVVVGVREGRQETGMRRLLFDAFHELFFRMTRGAMPKNSGTFGLMDREVADRLKSLPETTMFLPALRCWFGYPMVHVAYMRDARIAGEAKQSYVKLFSYAWDGLASFSQVPLRFISLAGLLVAVPSATYGLFLVILRVLQLFGWFSERKVEGFTTVAAAVFFMGSVQLLCLGILGEYLGRIFQEVKRRPHYVVESEEAWPGGRDEA